MIFKMTALVVSLTLLAFHIGGCYKAHSIYMECVKTQDGRTCQYIKGG